MSARQFGSRSFHSHQPAPAVPSKPQVDCMTIDRWNPEDQRFDQIYVERCSTCGTYHEPPMCAFSTAKEDTDVQF